LLLGVTLAWSRIRRGISSQTDPSSSFALFLEDGWRWDTVLQRCFVLPLIKLSQGLVMLDRRLWDGIVHALVYLTMLLARIVKQLDGHLSDGLVRKTSRWAHTAWLALRRVQTGNLQFYLILSTLAVISIGVVILMLLK
jgi:hypothetical protein